MIRKYATLLVVGLLGAVGCNSGKDTPGGPNATDPNHKPPMVGNDPNTFTLTASSVSLKQGDSKTIPITIKRGDNFQEDVSIKFVDLPTGVTSDPVLPMIKHGDKDTMITLKAAATAALGDFTVKLMGHPTKGPDSIHNLKISISGDSGAAAASSRDQYIAEKTKLLQELDAKYDNLKTNAAKADGTAKAELEKKAAEVKVKRDAAAKKLDELKTAAPDKWESFKDSVGNAFDDVKQMFK